MNIEVTIQAKHCPPETFEDWDHIPEPEEEVEVLCTLDYVPYREEEGGDWDEILASGGYLEHVWLGEEEDGIDILTLISKKEKADLEQWAENRIADDA